jgi:hypothetical protein
MVSKCSGSFRTTDECLSWDAAPWGRDGLKVSVLHQSENRYNSCRVLFPIPCSLPYNSSSSYCRLLCAFFQPTRRSALQFLQIAGVKMSRDVT